MHVTETRGRLPPAGLLVALDSAKSGANFPPFDDLRMGKGHAILINDGPGQIGLGAKRKQLSMLPGAKSG